MRTRSDIEEKIAECLDMLTEDWEPRVLVLDDADYLILHANTYNTYYGPIRLVSRSDYKAERRYLSRIEALEQQLAALKRDGAK